MTTKKHTPWKLEQCEKWPFRLRIVDSERRIILETEPYTFSSEDKTPEDVNRKELNKEWQENMRLFAAAPELYRALDDLIDLAEAAMERANRDGAEYDIQEELKEARAALAKAQSQPVKQEGVKS